VLLILADRHDNVAAGVAACVSAAGGEWTWLSPLDVATASWTHTVGAGGAVTTRVRTAGGLTADLAATRGVLNRIAWLPPVPYSRADDRDYAAMERHALHTSVLAGISAPMANPVRPPSLSGPMLDAVAWLALAARARIPVRGMRLNTDGRRWREPGWLPLDWRAVTTPGGEATIPLHAAVPVGRRPVAWAEPVGPEHRVTVVGNRAYEPPDAGWGRQCAQLTAASGCLLLQVDLAQRRSDGSWVVIGADPNPAALPPAAIEALVELLDRGGATTAVPGEPQSS
jgi:hypothetical protein